jgi:hypothetical protein
MWGGPAALSVQAVTPTLACRPGTVYGASAGWYGGGTRFKHNFFKPIGTKVASGLSSSSSAPISRLTGQEGA